MAAASDRTVLILGETGAGKELVAHAVHRLSARAARPLQSVNMATLSDELAAADLFGVVRGAFTGATSSRPGLFALANRGSLFLDEIGETPPGVQRKLLTALQTGDFRPVGATQDEHSDARVIAATDADLSRGFNRPLLHRLSGIVIHVPPVRERREDIGLLARHLLGSTLADPTAVASVPPPLVRALCLHDWRGNVRQLQNAMGRLALQWRFGTWPSVEEFLGEPLTILSGPDTGAVAGAPAAVNAIDAASDAGASPMPHPGPAGNATDEGDGAPPTATPPMPVDLESDRPAEAASRHRPTFRPPSSVTVSMLEAALQDSDWSLRATATLLGVSRPSLYNLLARHNLLRPAGALSATEIAAARDPGPVDLATLASRLRTSREALRRQMRLLGLELPPDSDSRH
jgi:two-component system nitrogen regulation response regulator GlnG